MGKLPQFYLADIEDTGAKALILSLADNSLQIVGEISPMLPDKLGKVRGVYWKSYALLQAGTARNLIAAISILLSLANRLYSFRAVSGSMAFGSVRSLTVVDAVAQLKARVKGLPRQVWEQAGYPIEVYQPGKKIWKRVSMGEIAGAKEY